MATTTTTSQPTEAEWQRWLSAPEDVGEIARQVVGAPPPPPPPPVPASAPATLAPRPPVPVSTPFPPGGGGVNPALVEEPPEPAVSEGFLAQIAKADPELSYLYGQRATAKQARDEAVKRFTADTRARYDKQGGDIRGLRARMPGAVPEPPAPLTLPEPPSRALRPFGMARKGEPIEQTLIRTLETLGLLGQMGVGIAGGFAPGALAAYQGALAGWHEGDKQRAEREWLDYTAYVDKMRLEHRSLMDGWRAVVEKYGHDMDRLKTEAVMFTAEHQLDDKYIKLAAEDPARLDQELQKAEGALTDLLKSRRDLNKTLLVESIKAGEKQKDRESLEAHRRAEVEHWRRQDAKAGAGAKGDKMLGESAAKWENAAGERPDPRLTISEAVEGGFRPVGKLSTADTYRSTLVLADQIKALALKLKDKGFLASSEDVASVKFAQSRAWMFPGDPDLVAFKSHAGTLVGFLRQLGDIGPRAMAAYMSAVNIIENATTAEAVTAAVDQLVAAIGAARPPQPGGSTPGQAPAPPAQAPVSPPAARGQSSYPAEWVK